jgi:hypothetical protein
MTKYIKLTEEQLRHIITSAMCFVRNKEEYNRPHTTNEDISLKATKLIMELLEK